MERDGQIELLEQAQRRAESLLSELLAQEAQLERAAVAFPGGAEALMEGRTAMAEAVAAARRVVAQVQQALTSARGAR